MHFVLFKRKHEIRLLQLTRDLLLNTELNVLLSFLIDDAFLLFNES